MTYIGQSVRRFEDHRLLTGQGSFVEDMKLPDLLHALVLRSPYAHAGIRSIDVGFKVWSPTSRQPEPTAAPGDRKPPSAWSARST